MAECEAVWQLGYPIMGFIPIMLGFIKPQPVPEEAAGADARSLSELRSLALLLRALESLTCTTGALRPMHMSVWGQEAPERDTVASLVIVAWFATVQPNGKSQVVVCMLRRGV